MRDDHFEAVTIETERIGRLANITNTRQVAERLAGNWPAAHKGAAYRKAVKATMDHLRGKKDAAAVREAFIGAAKEADIFVRSVWRAPTPVWIERRPGIYDVRIKDNASFLATQSGDGYEVLLPGRGRTMYVNRAEVERACREYLESLPDE